ncbi:MAG: isochorismatase family protein [Sandaracinaceae bacterium]|nr:isochorismatase family protein [Sandaracinaceae bacterium]
MTAPLDPSSTVFVDVDTQVDFVEPDGALYVPGGELLKPAFATLLEAARRHDRPVIASADAHPPGDPEFATFPPHCLAGTPGQRRVAETEPTAARVIDVAGVDAGGEGRTTVLEKVKFDLFTNPAAERELAATGAKTAIVFGLALDYCVRAAALGLRERGYETVVVRDATAPVTAEGGARVEAELRDAGVRFATTAEVDAAFP